jgi:hypothetical protein
MASWAAGGPASRRLGFLFYRSSIKNINKKYFEIFPKIHNKFTNNVYNEHILFLDQSPKY